MRRLRSFALGAWLPVTLFVIWWFASKGSTDPYFPALSKIVHSFRANWLFAHVGSDLVPSLKRIALGYLIAVVVGIGLGVALGSVQLLRRAVEPSLEFIRAVPVAALIPVTIVLLGVTDTQKIFIIAFGAVWPILLNTTDGVSGVDPAFKDVARSYGLKRGETLRTVTLPAALPQIMAGLRVALAISLLVIVLAELFAARNGLGFFILISQQTFRVADMWSGIFVLALVALAVNWLFVAVERRLLYWHRGWRASVLGGAAEPARTRRRLRRRVEEVAR